MIYGIRGSLAVALIAIMVITLGEAIAREPAGRVISSDTVALSAASEITGIGDLLLRNQAASEAITAEPVRFVDTTTPFISELIDGRAAWRITYPAFDLALDSQYVKSGQRLERSCKVWLDSLTGQLLRAVIRDEAAPPVTLRMPAPQESEEQLAVFRERYHGLPTVPPTLDMMAALRRSEYYPSIVPEIMIQYVLFSNERLSDSIPVWVIYMRGAPLASLSHPAYPGAVMTWKMVIDAVTGKVLSRSNIPHAEEDNIPHAEEDNIPHAEEE